MEILLTTNGVPPPREDAIPRPRLLEALRHGLARVLSRRGQRRRVVVREERPAAQREYAEDLILDLDAGSELVGIEVLDPDADLAPLVRDFGLDPHLLEVLAKLRVLMPEARRQLILA